MIGDVQHRVGIPPLAAVLDRGQVGRGVEECAIFLANDHRRRAPLEKHADRTVAFACHPLGHQARHDGLQPVMIKALAQRLVEGNSQPGIEALDGGHAVGHELPPQGQVLGIPRV